MPPPGQVVLDDDDAVARSRHSRHDDELVLGNFKGDVLEVVQAGVANDDVGVHLFSAVFILKICFTGSILEEIAGIILQSRQAVSPILERIHKA